MTDLRKAAEMALESLENLTTYDFKPSSIFKYFYPTAKGDYVDLREFKEKTKPAITALRQALAQPEQEPVRWFQQFGDAPLKREWVGLTDDEINKIVDLNTSDDGGFDIWCDGIAVASIVCAKLKEKNA